jgi:transposase-like protein
MPPCPSCQQPASKHNGRDRRGRQKYACRRCRRTFTEHTSSAFSGYRWPADVILTAVRWYLAYPLSSRQVLELLVTSTDVWGLRPGSLDEDGHRVVPIGVARNR